MNDSLSQKPYRLFFPLGALLGGLGVGHELGDVPRLFPRIDDKKLKEIMDELEAQAGAARAAESSAPAPRKDLAPAKDQIVIDDFSKVDLRVGIIREAEHVEGADRLLKLMVDIGEEKPRQVFAGIKSHYGDPSSLLGTKVILVANLKPRKMKFGVSEGMVLAASGGGKKRLCVAEFEGELHPGDTVS